MYTNIAERDIVIDEVVEFDYPEGDNLETHDAVVSGSGVLGRQAPLPTVLPFQGRQQQGVLDLAAAYPTPEYTLTVV